MFGGDDGLIKVMYFVIGFLVAMIVVIFFSRFYIVLFPGKNARPCSTYSLTVGPTKPWELGTFTVANFATKITWSCAD